MSLDPQQNSHNPATSDSLAAASHAMSDSNINLLFNSPLAASHLLNDKALSGCMVTSRTRDNVKKVSSSHGAITTIDNRSEIDETRYIELLDRYKAADGKVVHVEKQLDDLRREHEELQQQLAQETSNRLRYEKDNALLRAQITDMTSAQEPIREERYYILEFNQIGIDVESWAVKETRTMPTQSLSKADSFTIVSELVASGEHGKKAAKWFGNKDKRFFQERRNRIAVIRHVVAVVLFDRVFDRFAFGFSREQSMYFDEIEKRICLNGFRIV